MRRLYVSVGLIALMAALSGLHVWHMDTFTGQLSDLLTQAQEQVERENWDEATRLTHQVKDRWMNHERYLHITLRHADTDAIHLHGRSPGLSGRRRETARRVRRRQRPAAHPAWAFG